MEKQYKVGIIGYGQRLQGIFSRVSSLSQLIVLYAIVDPNQLSREKAQQQNKDVRFYETAKELCSDPEISWVFIGSWNKFHKEQVIEAFKGNKHVFCEKPLATTIQDCLDMREAWYQTGKKNKFIIGFTLRFSDLYNKIREIVHEKKLLGDIISMEFNETLGIDHGGYIMGDWRRTVENSGGHLLEKTSHDFDLVNWILNTRAKKVASFGGVNFFIPKNEKRMEEIGNNAYRRWEGLIMVNPFSEDKDIVDNQIAIIEYENNVRATFHTNCNVAQGMLERRMYFCGSLGTLRADCYSGDLEYQLIGYGQQKVKQTFPGGGHGNGDSILCQGIVDSILQDKDLKCGIEDGLNSALTCLAIDIARFENKVLDMKDIWELKDKSQGQQKQEEKQQQSSQ